MPASSSLSVKDQALVALVRIYFQTHSRIGAEWLAGQIGLSDRLTDLACDPSRVPALLDWKRHPDGWHLVVQDIEGMPFLN